MTVLDTCEALLDPDEDYDGPPCLLPDHDGGPYTDGQTQWILSR